MDKKAASSAYVQYGCGFSVGDGWQNFDSSPTLRIERIPIVGAGLGRLAGNAQSFPKSVKFGDITKGLPVADNSARGVYASHVLEHLALNDFRLALQNTIKILEPDGIFRLVVPDLQERARHYIREVSDNSADASGGFMRRCHLGLASRPRSILAHIRLMVGGSSHLWMWDEPSIVEELVRSGFANIRRCEFGDAEDPMFKEVEEESRFVDSSLGIRELAVEARKPGSVELAVAA